jgi:methylglutaconyl-CoA hydratase
MSETVHSSLKDGVRTLTLHRPERRNAMNPEMRTDLIAALRKAGADTECRVVVLCGAGEAFCAGLDLKVISALGERTAGEHTVEAEQMALLFRTLYECPRPTIAAVHGAAIAGGAGLATICDFSLAEPGAWFAFTEVKIGYVPALVSAYLVLLVGEKRARDLLLTGRVVAADEAFRLGLVNEVAPRGELMERAEELAGRLIENSPQSLRATKALLAAHSKPWLDAAVAGALMANAESRGTTDFREGVAAFIERRKPSWANR